MSARSVNATLNNNASFNLQLLTSSINLQHGEWTTYPPSNILAGGNGNWQTDSDGFLTGTEGSLVYQFIYTGNGTTSIETLKVYWDDPYDGSNGYSITSSVPALKVGYTGGDGNNATVVFSVSDK